MANDTLIPYNINRFIINFLIFRFRQTISKYAEQCEFVCYKNYTQMNNLWLRMLVHTHFKLCFPSGSPGAYNIEQREVFLFCC